MQSNEMTFLSLSLSVGGIGIRDFAHVVGDPKTRRNEKKNGYAIER